MVKKAQVKIQQTAFMLIALTILFVLIFLFFISFKLSDVNQSAQDLNEQNAILAASRLAGSPEFSCHEAYGSSKTYCVDLDKAYLLSKNTAKYENFWGVDNIEIRKLYPEEPDLCADANYPNCGYIKLFNNTGGADHSVFVNLCRKENLNGTLYNKCEMGKIVVRYDLI